MQAPAPNCQLQLPSPSASSNCKRQLQAQAPAPSASSRHQLQTPPNASSRHQLQEPAPNCQLQRQQAPIASANFCWAKAYTYLSLKSISCRSPTSGPHIFGTRLSVARQLLGHAQSQLHSVSLTSFWGTHFRNKTQRHSPTSGIAGRAPRYTTTWRGALYLSSLNSLARCSLFECPQQLQLCAVLFLSPLQLGRFSS